VALPLHPLTTPSPIVSAEIIRLHNGWYSVSSPGEGFGSTFSVYLPVYLAPSVESDSLPLSRIQQMGSLGEVAVMEEGGIGGGDHNQAPMSLLDLRRRNSPVFPLDSDPGSCAAPTALTAPSGYSKQPSEALPQAWRALVVDDAASNRKIMCRFLKLRGIKADEAECGDQAIQMCAASLSGNVSHTTANSVTDCSSATPFDVIFLDHNMPGLSGPETAQKILELGYRGHLIGLTGHADSEHHQSFLASGVSQVLVKPVSVSVLDHLFEGTSSSRSLFYLLTWLLAGLSPSTGA
jgi:CheY-like chemotaxis protein